MATRERVLELRKRGWSAAAIAGELALSKSTIAYHLRRAGEPPDPKFNRRYDWAEIQRYYDAGHTVRECLEHFGCASKTFADACRRGANKTRPPGMPLAELLAGRRSRMHLKFRLVRLGLLEYVCCECGISEWRGRPLSLALHHVNGDGHDNRLENLQLLCPNCHSQTENFAGRNRRRRAARDAASTPGSAAVAGDRRADAGGERAPALRLVAPLDDEGVDDPAA